MNYSLYKAMRFSKNLFLLIPFFFLGIPFVHAQEERSLNVYQTEKGIELDGQLSPGEWTLDKPADDFWQYFPSDSVKAEYQTQIHMQYDKQNLYIGIYCESAGNEYVVSSLKRDYQAWRNDNITLVIDTYKDGTNAFVFGVTPFGVLREALIANGGNSFDNFSNSWENKWTGEAYIGDGFWTAELVIPFNTIRFDDQNSIWGFNAYRFNLQANERSTWCRIPINQIITSLAFTGDMNWENTPPPSKKNISLIPYISSSIARDREANEDIDPSFNAGVDAKIGISSGLNLDLTVLPDFSQVEVDRQVTNLDRFEIFFPERRQFFLENADLFSGFGFDRMNPFFSRRIGVAKDTIEDELVENPMLFGARLSGKINDKTRIGLLTSQTAKDEAFGLPSYNYSVAAVQQNIFQRSNVGFIMVNKQHFNEEADAQTYDKFNRVMGVDFNLGTNNNRWNGKTFYHHSISESDRQGGGQHGTFLEYTRRSYRLGWSHQWIDNDFDAQVGYVPRKNIIRINPEVEFFFYPDSKSVNRSELRFEYAQVSRPEEGVIDRRYGTEWEIRFNNSSNLQNSLNYEYIYLTDSFDPSGVDSIDLPADTDYNNLSLNVRYRSDNRKKFSYNARIILGTFFDGMRYATNVDLNYRLGLLGNIGVNINYNRIQREAPYSSANLVLIGPKIDLSFSKKLFWTTFIQYNNQADNLNINSRLQWRYQPASDIYLVYTDNYYSDFSENKNRALIFKVNYWLNL